MADEHEAEAPTVPVIVDEVEQTAKDDSKGSSAAGPDGATESTQSSSAQSPPATSPPAASRSPNQDYYVSRPRTDRLGNVLPDRRKSAMSSVYGNSKITLPGDLGSKDPRRPKSPAPGPATTLPGDLGPKDPRRPKSPASSVLNADRSAASSPAGSSHHIRHVSDEGGVRLQEDPEPEDHHDSESDADADNDNDTDGDDSHRGRGRKRPEPGRTTAGKATNVREDSEDSERDSTPQFVGGIKPDPTKGQSMLSFLADPTLRAPRSRSGGRGRRVRPSNAFDAGPSGTSSPMPSDDESQVELRAAQKLTLSMSAIHSTPSAHRVIRQIIRGDFELFQRESEAGKKRQRMYLVATDMSSEAEYALEWTIGTVLRDGDTLFAVYAAGEESVSYNGEGGVEIGRGAESVRDTSTIIKGLPASTTISSPLAQAESSKPEGVYSQAETERRHAMDIITNRCVSLLRKTRLQVRVVVEVFHCKSPKHMICEVIDYLSPTLVIIGSRGRSAVKGVLLGSFSNYLVTKSSVPVMVARKKLRKHSTAKQNRDGTAVPYQNTGRAGRFSNIIQAPKQGQRVTDWNQVGID